VLWWTWRRLELQVPALNVSRVSRRGTLRQAALFHLARLYPVLWRVAVLPVWLVSFFGLHLVAIVAFSADFLSGWSSNSFGAFAQVQPDPLPIARSTSFVLAIIEPQPTQPTHKSLRAVRLSSLCPMAGSTTPRRQLCRWIEFPRDLHGALRVCLTHDVPELRENRSSAERPSPKSLTGSVIFATRVRKSVASNFQTEDVGDRGMPRSVPIGVRDSLRGRFQNGLYPR